MSDTYLTQDQLNVIPRGLAFKMTQDEVFLGIPAANVASVDDLTEDETYERGELFTAPEGDRVLFLRAEGNGGLFRNRGRIFFIPFWDLDYLAWNI